MTLLNLSRVESSASGADPGYYKENAINGYPLIGNETFNVDACECCFISRGGEQNWLQLDLNEQRLIQRIVILGRSDGKSSDTYCILDC